MRFNILTRTGLIVAMVLAFVVGAGLVAYFLWPKDDSAWTKALIKEGNSQSVVYQLLDLPTQPELVTDSSGYQLPVGAFLYKLEDEDGKPMLAVYYIVSRVFISTLPKAPLPDTVGVTDSTVKDSTE